MRRVVSAVVLMSFVAGCASQIEEADSANYAPVYPVEPIELARDMPSGAIYSDTAMGLFAADRRAARIGDILTVDFSERFAASKSQAAGASKSGSFALDVPDAISFGLDDSALGGGTSRSYSGKGNATQSNSLTGRLSVTVTRILPGGNLEIIGQKKLTLNNGQEYVRLHGIVRPSDISADNVVRSDRIAAAEIKYVGAGDIADTAKQGWFGRAMTAIAPF